MIVELKEITIRLDDVNAYGKLLIPHTLQTPTYYAIAVWFKGVPEPITITYSSEDERDNDLAIIREGMLAQATSQYS